MVSSRNLGPTRGLILLGKNYEFWSLRMRSFLQAQECWDPVDHGYVELDPTGLSAMTNQQKIAQATQRNRENKAKFWIQNSVDDSIFSKITGAGTSKQAWDILKSSYQGNDRVKTVKLQTLRTQFETLRMTTSENVDQFMTRLMGIVNQIRLTGETITDQRIVEKILISLPKKFEMVVTTILESKDLSIFSTDELIGSLVTHETRLHLTDESISNSFKTQFSFSRGRGRGRSRGHQGRGRNQSNPHSSGGNRQQYSNQNFQGQKQQQQNQHENFQPQRGRGRRSNEKSSIQCYYCKKYGNYESECSKKQADELSGRANVSNHTGETSRGMFLSCHKVEKQPKDLWLLDSGCSNHMTGNKDLLSCIDFSPSFDITLGNDYLVKVQGKGTVPILTKHNVKKDINNVYHVPDLKHNLLSVGQLIEHGYKVLFEGSSCKIYDKNPNRKLIFEIHMTPNMMFPLTLRTANLIQPYAQSASTLNETMVWHTRFGHLPFQSLSLLHKNSMVKGLPIFKEQIPPCESCILGKHKRTSFPQSSNQAKQHLELVHTDLCGPIQIESIGGSFYFLTFIDDFNRKIWIYFLRHKSETFAKFKEFKAEAEKQSGKYIKALKPDGGGEHNSREFANFYKSQGIIMQAIARYTPQ
jgi:hypothetical protein